MATRRTRGSKAKAASSSEGAAKPASGRKTRTRPSAKKGGGLGKVKAAAGSTPPDNTDNIEATVPSGLAGAYVNSKLHEQKLRTAGLSEPRDFEGEVPELPGDIAAVDHDELSNLIMRFQNALSTATWQASKAYIASDIYEEIADYLENRAILGSTETNDAKRRADAKTDDLVLAWRGRQKEAYHDYVRFRDYARTIEGKVKVVSRVGGFKGEDDDASDRSARRTAGKKPAVGRGRRRTKD